MRDLHRLVDAVQRNCHIADARHAREATLCTYLLEMREYYRWEHDIPLACQPPREDVGRWLTERESLWAELEEADYCELEIAGERYDPFDAGGINRALFPEGLAYGAGIGRFGRPHFFLGRLAAREQREGLAVLKIGCEYARDLTGIPAALQGDTVVVRSEALRRWLWEKFELWGLKRREGALADAVGAYRLDARTDAGLDAMVEAETETLILHELGEARAGALLGEGWSDMLAALDDRRAEIVARAVRDLLADCLVTLPRLIERAAEGSIHFHFANFEGMRRDLFPALEAAYRTWRAGGDETVLRRAIECGAAHWAAVGRAMLSGWAGDPRRVATLAEDPAVRLVENAIRQA